MNGPTPLLTKLDGLRRRSFLIGIVGLALCALGAFLDLGQFFRSYLTAYSFWTGFALACLAILMLHHLTGGLWGNAIRGPLEAGARTVPLMAVLFLPIAFGIRYLYPWAGSHAGSHYAATPHKLLYFKDTFFFARSAIDFAVWIALSLMLSRWSAARDRTDDERYTGRLQGISGPGLVLYFLTVSFAAIDWVMSLEPDWYSSIFGVMWMTGQFLATLALMIVVTTRLGIADREQSSISPGTLNDLGNLLLAFVMLWAYMSFSQFLIIWSGNLTEEIPWYLRRTRNGWQWLGIVMIVFQFALPFIVLLFRDIKRHSGSLARIAALVVIMHWVANYWVVTPAFNRGGISIHWLDLATTLGIGGLWFAMFLGSLKAVLLIPRRPSAVRSGHGDVHAGGN